MNQAGYGVRSWWVLLFFSNIFQTSVDNFEIAQKHANSKLGCSAPKWVLHPKSKLSMFCISKLPMFMYLKQAATIRLPDCLGQSLFGSCNNIYIILAWPGKYKSEVSLHQAYKLTTQVTNIRNHVFYKPSTCIFWLFNLDILFCYLGTFGQAVLWPSLPDWAIKKRGNCCSLIWNIIWLP